MSATFVGSHGSHGGQVPGLFQDTSGQAFRPRPGIVGTGSTSEAGGNVFGWSSSPEIIAKAEPVGATVTLTPKTELIVGLTFSSAASISSGANGEFAWGEGVVTFGNQAFAGGAYASCAQWYANAQWRSAGRARS